MQLHLSSGGAAQGLVHALAAKFKSDIGCDIAGTFGAVGAMRDRLLAGEPADLLILTQSLSAELTRTGHVLVGSAVDLGVVRTGMAVRTGDPLPPIVDAAALRSCLLAPDAIHRRVALMRQTLGDAYHAAVVGSKRLEWQTYGEADAELVAAEHRFRY